MKDKLKGERIKPEHIVDHIYAYNCLRTAKGCYTDGIHTKGSKNTFTRKGRVFDVVRGQLLIDGVKSVTITTNDVLSVAPTSKHLYILREGGILRAVDWITRESRQARIDKRARQLYSFRGQITTFCYMDSATLALMMNCLGLSVWDRSREGKELYGLGWGRDRVHIKRNFYGI